MPGAQLLALPHPSEPAARRAQRLMDEARKAAAEQIALLENALIVVGELSADVANGGDVYPVGIRDLSRKLSLDAAWCAHTIASIAKNAGRCAEVCDRPRCV